ncbi:MAG: lytic murein transglycosylase, partial [Bradyrhizobium sp.]|nr:lytic murein transglycosylase [Bradyrhizobium sp.]
MAPEAAATRPKPAPSMRAASCHNGQSFDRFLAELKQRAVAEGVSQRAIAAASPYLTYDQGIVNRDRGQRVFGQLFTEFAGRMAAV